MRRLLALGLCLTSSFAAHAQISFTSVIDLALRNAPKVLVAQAEVDRSVATLQQTKDVYIPALSAGSGLGYTYGFPVGTPTLYNIQVQSLAYDQAQANYIRSARAGLEAAKLHLSDVRQEVAEDAAITYITLDYDLRRLKALDAQLTAAGQLVTFTRERQEAGLDPEIELIRSRRTQAQIHLQHLVIDDDVASQRSHLRRLTGIAVVDLQTDSATIPDAPKNIRFQAADGVLPDSVKSSYVLAQSKLQQAFGDARKMYRPQVYLAGQYARFAQFNNYAQYYCGGTAGNRSSNCELLNNFSFGIQLNLPVVDFVKRAHARESLAEAERSRHEADMNRDLFLENRGKILRSSAELEARAEVASLDREIAQNQLDTVRTQMTAGNPDGQPVTPQDEQNAIVQERAKYLDYLDADQQLATSKINLLRASGQLESWIKGTITP